MPKTKLLIAIILALAWALSIKISLEKTDSNLLSSFSKSKESSELSLLTKFDSSKRLLIFIPGFNTTSQKNTKEIAEKLKANPLFESVFFRPTDTDDSVKRYIVENYPYIADGNLSKLSDIKKEIKKLQLQTEDPFNYKPIDKSDPFGIFALKNSSFEFRNGLLAAKDKGYFIVAVAKATPADTRASKEIRAYAKTLEEDYKDAVFFAPHFFSAENSQIIEDRIKILSAFSIVALVMIYIFILRNLRLLALCVTVLGFSISIAAALTSFVYGQLATLALAFGAGIASIAEDYLFLLYLNKNFENKSFNKEVFVGFVATFCSLMVMSIFADGLIAQISFFTACSIAISYVAFLYLPRVYDFRSSGSFFEFNFRLKPLFTPLLIAIVAFVMLALASINIKTDFELQNLDYNNKDLKSKAEFFTSLLGNKESVLIEASSKEELLKKTYMLKNMSKESNSIANFWPSYSEIESKNIGFATLQLANLKSEIDIESKKAGFKEGYLKDSYQFLQNPSFVPNEIAVKKLGYEILQSSGAYFTLAQIPKLELANAKQVIGGISTPKELAYEISKKEFERFILPALIATAIIIIVLAFKTRRNFLFAFNFILFPLATLTLYLSLVGSGVNIMHIFGIFLIAIYGIDYGIYLEKSMNSINLRAVLYSLSTTFAGFGILVFSDIKAISSIGEAVCVGIVSVLLMIFQKKGE
jgi:uncharacterized protein